MPPHWHEEAELAVVREGSGTYRIDLIDYRVGAGDVLFIPPESLHGISCQNGGKLVTETFVFHPGFLGAGAADICASRYLAPLAAHEYTLPCHITADTPLAQKITGIFGTVTTLYTRQPFGYELSVKARLLDILAALLEYGTKTTETPRELESAAAKLRTVLEYNDAHLAEPITVRELAALCFVSDGYFMRFFRRYMAMTCVAYINNRRLERAVALFESGRTSILDVSLSVGFHNLSYFHRAFKKRYRMTPGTFIRSVRVAEGQDGETDGRVRDTADEES